MSKRIIAIILAAILVVALVGCGKQKRKIIQLTLSTEDSEAILGAAGIKLPAAERYLSIRKHNTVLRMA